METDAAPGRTMLLEPTDPRWHAHAAAHGTSPFHHPAWQELLADCYGWRGLVFAAEEPGGEIASAVPLLVVQSALGRRRWISLPFTDSCPPVGAGFTDELARSFDRARREREVSRAEVRFAMGGPAGERRAGVTHVLTLGADSDRLFAGFRRGVKTGIHKAEREGLVVRRAEARSDLVDTYYRLHLATRRRLGVPVQPRRFFRLLWERFISRELGALLLGYASGKPVAGCVYLHWNGAWVYKYGASDPAYWNLRPNNAIQWEAIRSACEAGYASFDFGRSDFRDVGLRNFKAGFGASEQLLTYSTLGAPAHSRSETPGVAAAVIRHSPLWLCRVAGELLYRHAA